MDTKQTFNNEAQEYEFTSRAVNIYFDEALDTLVENILTKKENPTILDVCCGTCMLTERVAKKFPRAKFYGVDFSTEMLKIGQKRMEKYNFTPILGDICKQEDMKNIPMVDLIITSLGIHNVHGKEQKQLAINNIISHLKEGGEYITFDYIKGKDKAEQERFNKVQKDWLLLTYNQNETEDWLKLLKDEDDPETFEDNFLLLKNAGCSQVKLLWSKDYLAIWKATKMRVNN